jgi:hypothetical protein
VVFDNSAPVLTVTQIQTQAPLSSTLMVLVGAVSDGGPDVAVSVRMQPPNDDVARMAAARDGDAWSFDLPADIPGR